jgi:hypothetical protein
VPELGRAAASVEAINAVQRSPRSGLDDGGWLCVPMGAPRVDLREGRRRCVCSCSHHQGWAWARSHVHLQRRLRRGWGDLSGVESLKQLSCKSVPEPALPHPSGPGANSTARGCLKIA